MTAWTGSAAFNVSSLICIIRHVNLLLFLLSKVECVIDLISFNSIALVLKHDFGFEMLLH